MRIRTQLIASIAVSALLCVAMGMGVWLALQSQEEFQEAQRRAQTAARESAGLLALTQEFAFYGEERAARQWWKRHANLSEAVSATALPKQINSPSLLELRGSLKQLPELFAGFEKLSKEPLDDLTQYCSVSIFSHIFSLEPRAAAQAIAARSLSPHFAQQSGCG